MRRSLFVPAVALLLLQASPYSFAQRHAGSPPTAPRPTPPVPIVAASSGMGPIQFVAVNYGVPAPQSLTRQLRVDDDRTRAAALSAIGVPGQYLQHGHIGIPRSIELSFAPLGSDDDVDAVLTVELDQHIVTAILIPDGDNWRRIATLFVADSADDPRTVPSNFVVLAMVDRGHYRAIFHATATDSQHNYVENEAHLRIFNKRATITMSFVSASRDCTISSSNPTSKHQDPGCNILRRWFQPDPGDPIRHFTLVTGSGHLSTRETATPIDFARTYETSHLRSFTCQPFAFNDPTQHFEPTAPNAPCSK